MKESLLLSAGMLLMGIMTFTSCNKNKKRCWECKVFITYHSTPNASPVQDSSYKMCDHTQDEINEYSQEVRSDSGFINTQGVPDTLMKRTSCQKEKKEFIDRLTPDFSWN